MNPLRAALYAEARKAFASRVMRATTVLTVAGISLLSAALVSAARAGNEQVSAQLGTLAGETGWPLLTGVVAQVTSAGALLAFGTALSWSFGREFTDGTAAGLFALPVRRQTIAYAKLIVHIGWVAGVALLLTALVLGTGLLLGLRPVDGAVTRALWVQLGLTVLTGLLAVPAGWAATSGRGPLPGVATTIGLIAVGQVAVVMSVDAAGWVPVAAPALWALFPGAVGPLQLAAVAVVPVGFGALTAHTWRRLQLTG